jgi:hypothetical protein
MLPKPVSNRWRGKDAIVLVHGVGNAAVGDYADLVKQISDVLGDRADKFAIYMVYYDQVNDWFQSKENAKVGFTRLVQGVRSMVASEKLKAKDPAALGNVISEIIGDVIWPVLLADARNAVRALLIDQLIQVVNDGDAAGVAPADQRISIIAHSMGCFHTYEALHTIADDPTLAIGPASGGVTFANVVFMASPVRLIRTVAEKIDALVPQRETMRTLSKPLGMPMQASVTKTVPVAAHTVSISGNLDPVSGHFFRTEPAWAYTELPGQERFVDEQQLAMIDGSDEFSLTEILHNSLQKRSAPDIQPNNPHSWDAYVQRHAGDLRGWLVSV